jgi:hypothetical protein
MNSTRLIWLVLFLPLAVNVLLQGSSCKDNNSQSSKGNSTRPPADQVNPTPNEQALANVPEGLWGGVGIRLQVTKQGAEIEYDCAHGRISEPLSLNAKGHFQAKGTHVRERGGPIRLGESPIEEAASYTGDVKGQTMTLEVFLTAKSESIGRFTLTRGREARLRKCL